MESATFRRSDATLVALMAPTARGRYPRPRDGPAYVAVAPPTPPELGERADRRRDCLSTWESLDLPATRPLLPQWDFAAGGASRSSISSFSELQWSWRDHRNISRIVPAPGVPPPGRRGPSGPPGWRQTAGKSLTPFLY